MYSKKTADDGQRDCPKHVEFLDKNKFGKLMGLLVLVKRRKRVFVFLLNPQHPPLHKISNTTCCSGGTFLLLVSLASIRYIGLSLQGPLSLYI
jgi:hypothetical protein